MLYVHWPTYFHVHLPLNESGYGPAVGLSSTTDPNPRETLPLPAQANLCHSSKPMSFQQIRVISAAGVAH